MATSDTAAGQSTLRFGPFELEPDTGELRKDGVRVKLRHQPSRVLVLLASQPGRLVTRGDIRSRLWASTTHIDYEQGLNYCIRDIRSALGDTSGEPRFVETLPRRGYRFIAEVEERECAPGPPAPRRRLRLLRSAAVGSLALGLLGLVGWALRGGRYTVSWQN